MSAPSNAVKYLLFDVESVADGVAISKTRYAHRGLSPEHAISLFRQELIIEGGRDFIPYTYHIPVAVVAAKVREDFSLMEIVSPDEPPLGFRATDVRHRLILSLAQASRVPSKAVP